MKIKKFNKITESNENPFDINTDFDDDIIIKITFGGEKTVKLSDIKETEYYTQYVEDSSDPDKIESAIFYGIEDYIHDKGLGGYQVEICDKNGSPIDLEVYLKSNKYNL